VITTLLGIGCFPEDHILSLGMIGMHGMAYANMAVSASDLVIAIGMRFDDRATGRVSGFAPHAQIIHIDIDPAEIGKNVRVDVPIVGDVKHVLHELNKQVEVQTHMDWIAQVEEWRRDHPVVVIRETDSLLPQFVIRKIYEVTKGDAIIVTGVGQNQMWAAQHFWYNRPNTLISSGGLGTMGFELPAAIGAKVGKPDENVWAIAGDGGFQMTIQELGTAAQDNIAVKIAIINNGFLGMVRQWQELFYKKNYVATPLSNPDFVKVAEAYGISGLRVTDKKLVVSAIQKAMEHDGPFLIDFVVEPEENIYPMVAPGCALSEIIEAPKHKVKVKTDSQETSNL
jgi:acetolactate synthase-1/2/3 large subunit